MSSFTNTGKVKWFNNNKGFGFITDSNGTDYFVHQSNIDAENAFRFLAPNEDVQYNLSTDDSGKTFAVSVTGLNEPLRCMTRTQDRPQSATPSSRGSSSRGRGGFSNTRGRGGASRGRGGYSSNRSRGNYTRNQELSKPAEGTYAAALLIKKSVAGSVEQTPAPETPVSAPIPVQTPSEPAKSTRGRPRRGGKN